MAISIPFFSLKRQWNNLKPHLSPVIEQVLDSQNLIGGKEIESFEATLASYLGVKHVISCNSGTDALWLALKGLNIQKETIVLTTPFSFIASSSEIVAHGAHPVFIDIDEKTYNICPIKLEKWLENNATMKNGAAVHTQSGRAITGILTVNVFGQCAEHDRITSIAQRWNLWTVEDAAQSIGSHVNNKKADGKNKTDNPNTAQPVLADTRL